MLQIPSVRGLRPLFRFGRPSLCGRGGRGVRAKVLEGGGSFPRCTSSGLTFRPTTSMVASTQLSSFSGSVAADTGRAGQSGVVHVQDTAGTGEQLTLRLRISGVYKVGKLLRTLGCPFDDFGQLRCCQRVPVVSSRQYCAYV